MNKQEQKIRKNVQKGFLCALYTTKSLGNKPFQTDNKDNLHNLDKMIKLQISYHSMTKQIAMIHEMEYDKACSLSKKKKCEHDLP